MVKNPKVNMNPSRNFATVIVSPFLLLGIISFASATLAFTGKVVGVSDGDTITVMHQGKGEKVRLYGIDCPEKCQAFSQKAKQFTSDMVFGKVVEDGEILYLRKDLRNGHFHKLVWR